MSATQQAHVAPLSPSDPRPPSPGPSSSAPLPPPAPPLPPPPAPPLPSQRYVQRAATAFGRLAHPFLYGSRPSSAQGHRDGPRRPAGLRPSVRRSSSPVSSRSTAHKTGIPISALDVSPDRTHAVLAGRDILKTIKIADATCTEELNLRSKLSAYASTHNASRDAATAPRRDLLAANDVKWSRGIFSSTIATAAANGRIVVYDVNRPGLEIGRLHEHSRQVHRLAFNPHQGALLISGSQDGTVRMWDLRDLGSDRAVRVSGSIKKFYCHSDGVRDLRWSPADGVEFAVGTDSGAIQRWDFRRESAPLLKINAHDKTCLTLDWHPGGRYLASGSADKLVKVWDFKSSDRRMKPQWQLRAPQAVSKIRWRPGAAAGGDEGQDFRQITSLATSYDAKDPRIHIWDFKRPNVPFQVIDRYDSTPTDMLWHSEDLLWFVNSAGIFTQGDLKFAPSPLERLNLNVLAAGPDSQFCYFSEYRPKKQIFVAEAEDHFLDGESRDSSGEKLQSSSDPTSAGGDDALTLSSSLKKRRQRFASNRAPSHTSVTSSVYDSEAKLSDKSLLEPIYQSTQIPASGSILGVFDARSFQKLASLYTLPSWAEHPTTEEIIDSVRVCFEHNAILAAQTGQYRLAQTWSIIGHAACSELKMKHDAATSVESQRTTAVRWVDEEPTSHAKAKAWMGGSKLPAVTSPLETTSSVATPLARAVRGKPSISSLDAHALDHDQKSGKISFMSPAWDAPKSSKAIETPKSLSTPRKAELAEQAVKQSPGKTPFKLNTEEFSAAFDMFPDMERQMQERRDAMNNYQARPRSLLRLDNPLEEARSPLYIPSLDRHDSSESLSMFPGSQDSDPRSVPFTGSFEDSRRSEASAAISFGSKSYLDDQYLSKEPVHRASFDFPVNVEEQDPLPLHFSSFSNVGLSMPDEPEIAISLKETGWMPVRRPSTFLAPKIHVDRSTFESDMAQAPSNDAWVLFVRSEATREYPVPWSLPALLPPLLDYHLDTLGDTQLPAVVTLALFQFFPQSFEPVERCSAYLLAYHELLVSLKLFSEAAALRNAWVPHFSDLSAEATAEQGRGTGKDRAGLWCEECGRPVKGEERGWCKRCCTEWGPCALCELPDPPSLADLGLPDDDVDADSDDANAARRGMCTDNTASGTRLWQWCQGCGHGGHAVCLRAWWRTAGVAVAASTQPSPDPSRAEPLAAAEPNDPSDGACPVPGCGHDCVAGARRAARLRAAERHKARSASAVVRDEWIAPESRAVGSATRSLVVDGSSPAASREGGTSGASGSGKGGSTGIGRSASVGSGSVGSGSGARHAARTKHSASSASRDSAAPQQSASAASAVAGRAFSRRRESGPGKLGSGSVEGRDVRDGGGRRSMDTSHHSLEDAGRSLSGGGRRVRLAVPAEGEGAQGGGGDGRALRGASEPPGGEGAMYD